MFLCCCGLALSGSGIRNIVYEREDEWNLKKVEDVPGACDVYAIRYNRKWISELVSFQEVSELTGETPLFIASQTGSGKTTFIFNNCLPVAEREGKKALYLCNRVALKNQIKKEAMKNPVNKSKKVDGRKVGEYREFLTDKGISSEYRFGLIDIHTYQEMLAFPKSKVEEYSMVIMDEAHFFLSDAPFNAFTQVILDKIVSFFRRHRRIYLSATPQECMSVVYEAENSILSMAQAWVFHGNIYSECFYKPGLNVVIVDEDYSYLRPRFFEKNEEIIDIINKDTESKWLIFIRKKELRKELVSKLNIPNNDIAYYDAETDKELEQYKMLIEDEKLSHRVTLFVIFSIASINSLVLILFLILLMCPFPSKIKYVIHFCFFRKALSSHKTAYHIIQLYSNGDKKENRIATVGKVKLLICILYP